jgi:hypothetical protein
MSKVRYKVRGKVQRYVLRVVDDTATVTTVTVSLSLAEPNRLCSYLCPSCCPIQEQRDSRRRSDSSDSTVPEPNVKVPELR